MKQTRITACLFLNIYVLLCCNKSVLFYKEYPYIKIWKEEVRNCPKIHTKMFYNRAGSRQNFPRPRPIIMVKHFIIVCVLQLLLYIFHLFALCFFNYCFIYYFIIYFTIYFLIILVCGDVLVSGIRLVARDYLILSEIDRWRVITGRHICFMTGFSGQRACDRRLHKLRTADLLNRERIIYGVPAIYSLTSKGKLLIEVPNKKEQIRIEQIAHDIAVADSAIFFNLKYNIAFSDMVTEKQLHQNDGFGIRKHRPDFVFT